MRQWFEAVRAGAARVAERRRDHVAARANRSSGTRCFYCGAPFGPGGDVRTIDHRVPRSRGGTDGLVNLVFACRACNERKADLPEEPFTSSTWLRDRRRAVAARDAPR